MTPPFRPWPALALAVALGGCGADEQIDAADLCILPSEDRIEVEVLVSCASDHRGAELSCEVKAEEGGGLRVTSTFRDGKDPNESCAEALVASCRSEPLEPGVYAVRYDEDEFEIALPNVDGTCSADTDG